MFVIVAIGSNLYVIFSNKVNYKVFGFNEYSYSEFPVENIFGSFFDDSDLDVDNLKTKLLFIAMFLLNFVLNDIIMVILMLVLDIILIKTLKSLLDTKRNLTRRINTNGELKSKLKHFDQIQFRTTSVLVLNSFILIFIRTLNFVSALHLTIEHLNNRCSIMFNKTCLNHLEASEILYLMSSSYSLFVFYYLDANFNKTITDFLFKVKNLF